MLDNTISFTREEAEILMLWWGKCDDFHGSGLAARLERFLEDTKDEED